MEPTVEEDYLWLLSQEAAPLLFIAEQGFRERVNALKINKRLRKEISPSRAAIIIEQAQLRLRAQVKFDRASELFFTRKSLEQATGLRIAKHKARRWKGMNVVADVCCGIGGDLMAIAARDRIDKTVFPDHQRTVESSNVAFEVPQTVGVEVDKLTAMFADRNLRVMGFENASVRCDRFESITLDRFDAIHIDPDRRVNNRTVRGDFFQPPLAEIQSRLGKEQSLAIKVAPATPPHCSIPPESEMEWIGDNRECKEQVIWQGPVVQNAGCRTATMVNAQNVAFQFTATPADLARPRPEPDEKLGMAVYEPHPTVLAGGMVNALAHRLGLRPVDQVIDYLTGVPAEKCGLIREFRIDAAFKLSLKLLTKELRLRKIGSIVVKKRGIDQAIYDNICALKISGENQATVIATRHNGKRIALITNVQRREQGGLITGHKRETGIKRH